MFKNSFVFNKHLKEKGLLRLEHAAMVGAGAEAVFAVLIAAGCVLPVFGALLIMRLFAAWVTALLVLAALARFALREEE